MLHVARKIWLIVVASSVLYPFLRRKRIPPTRRPTVIGRASTKESKLLMFSHDVCCVLPIEDDTKSVIISHNPLTVLERAIPPLVSVRAAAFVALSSLRIELGSPSGNSIC